MVKDRGHWKTKEELPLTLEISFYIVNFTGLCCNNETGSCKKKRLSSYSGSVLAVSCVLFVLGSSSASTWDVPF